MDLLLQEKNEILISRIFKTQDLSQKQKFAKKEQDLVFAGVDCNLKSKKA